MDGSQMPANRDVLLEVNGLGKLYSRRASEMRRKLGRDAFRGLFGLAPPRVEKLQGAEFWAVRDVSFALHRGEAVGIIGLNGSGKTTTLRMLAGQLVPDAGEIVLHGTSAAMIDLQAGFQSSASGRDNIFLRAASLGFSRAETASRVDDIIAFSELEEAIDAPLVTYSSGMRMRLAFSVMAMVSPQVLFIDEVLAVGDFRFRQKCLGRVREMRETSAFVFVSHSMGDVERFCDHVMVLHKGVVVFEGTPKAAIEVYEALEPAKSGAESVVATKQVMGPTFANERAVCEVEHYWCDHNGQRINEVGFRDRLSLRVSFTALISIRFATVGVPVWAVNGHYTTGLSTQISGDELQIGKGERVDLLLEVDGGYLNPGILKSMLAINDGVECLYRQANPDLLVKVASHPTWGAVTVPHKWHRLNYKTESS